MMVLAVVAAGVWGALLVNWILGLRDERAAVSRRLYQTGTAPLQTAEPGSRFERWSLAVGLSLQRLVPAHWSAFVRRRLQAAGLRTTVEEFVGRWALIIIVWYLVVSSVALVARIPGWVTVAALVLILLTPFAVLYQQEAERTRRIRKEFPFLIDFMTMAVEGGLSLESGLLRAGTKLQGPLGDELHRYVQNINRGLTRRDALLALADNIALPEVTDFVQVLIQSTGRGLPLADVLRSQAQQMREFRRLRAEESAQKLPIKLLFPLIMFIFPTIFLWVLGPALIWVFENGLKAAG